MGQLSSSSLPPLWLGLDPGYDRLGWAVGYKKQPVAVVAAGCISTTKKDTLAERYYQLVTQLAVVLEQYQPVGVAMESLFFSNNQTTALKVAEARGAILSVLALRQIPITEYSPSQIKLAVAGYGKADKTAVQKMVKLQVSLPPDLRATRLLDDTYDAMAVLLTHLASARSSKGSV